MLCEPVGRRAKVTRTAECSGGCGRTLDRCRREEPICNECRREASAGSLTAAPRSLSVSVRKRQVANYHSAVWTLVKAEVSKFRRTRRRPPTMREYHRLERRVMLRLQREGVSTSAAHLPPSGNPRWWAMFAVLNAMVERVQDRGKLVKVPDIDPEKEYPDDHLAAGDDDRRPADAGGVGDRRAAVVGGRDHAALAR